MTSIMTRGIRALAIGLVAAGWASSASAAPIPYQTVGTVGNPTVGTPGLVYYTGVTNGNYDGGGTIDLGNFVVSTLARTTNASYTNVGFTIIASSGGDASEAITGFINGEVGPAVANPSLTATITSVAQYGNNSLPFMLSLPLDTPLQIALPGSNSLPTPTGLAGAVSAPPIPEPSTIAIFAVGLAGLGVWRRRASR